MATDRVVVLKESRCNKNWANGCLSCPLCCQQEFSSLLALREHLLYYIYRPISCQLCTCTLGGIHGLTRHLESHLEENEDQFGINCDSAKDCKHTAIESSSDLTESGIQFHNTASNELGSFKTNNIPRKCGKDLDVQNNLRDKCSYLINKELPIPKEDIPNLPDTADIISPEDSLLGSKLTCHTSGASLSSFLDEAVCEAVRAYVCNKCGAKIVGKDLYFKHIQGKCHKKKIEKCLTNEQKTVQDGVNCESTLFEMDSHGMRHLEHSQEYVHKQPICIETVDEPECLPYVHKKFDHDLGRKADYEASESIKDVQCYIQNFQSLLVDKLNQMIGNDMPTAHVKDFESISEDNVIDVIGDSQLEIISGIDERFETDICPLNVEELKDKDQDLPDKLKCKNCLNTFSRPSLLHRHESEIHSHHRFPCASCGMHFRSKRTLENHRGVHTAKTFQCSKCIHSCHTASGLRTHVFEAHSQKAKKAFVCHICLETFKKKYGLARHLQRKHGTDKLMCEFCGRAFLCKEDLALHKALHVNINSFKCDHCGKSFASLSSLKRHKLQQSNGSMGPLKCNQCFKTFKRRDSLQMHSKLHGGDHSILSGSKCSSMAVIPHTCENCGKRFKLQLSLKSHLLLCQGS